MKQKTCKQCRIRFVPSRPMQVCCSLDCAVDYGRKLTAIKAAKKALAERMAAQESRKTIRLKLESLKPLSQLAKDAEYWVNRYVRLRDFDKGCISCDRPATWNGQWHASHFKSVGANSALRFHLWNIHRACSICNNHLSGNIGEYARRLPERIGQQRFDYIQSHPRERKYTREYLVRLKAVAMRACKRLEKRNRNGMSR